MLLFQPNNHSFKTLLLTELKQTPSHLEDLKIQMLEEHQHFQFKTSMYKILNSTLQTPSFKPRNSHIKAQLNSQSNPLVLKISPSRNLVTSCTSLITPLLLSYFKTLHLKTSMEQALDSNLKISLTRPTLSTSGSNSVPSKTVNLMSLDSSMSMRTQSCRLTRAHSRTCSPSVQGQSSWPTIRKIPSRFETHLSRTTMPFQEECFMLSSHQSLNAITVLLLIILL